MITNKDMAAKTADFLLTVKAVKLNNEHPFTWASGRKSPIYCDNRVTLSYPEIRTFIRQRFVDIIRETWGDVDVIAGVATGGIAQGALVAQELGKPFVYVRSESKSHGLTNQIEGEIHEGQSVVVIEDLVSTGKSSLIAVKALRAQHQNRAGSCTHARAVFRGKGEGDLWEEVIRFKNGKSLLFLLGMNWFI